MDLTMIGILSFAIISNFIIVKIKFEKQRYMDAALDIGVFSIIAYIFFGTLGGMVISGVSSFLYSVYSWFFPPKFKSIDLGLGDLLNEETTNKKGEKQHAK